MMVFKIYSSWGLFGRRWYFRARARNGEIVLQSEGYRNHDDCLATVNLIRREADAVPIDDSEHEAMVLKYDFEGDEL